MVRIHTLRHPHRRSTGVVCAHMEHPSLGLVDHSQRLSSLSYGTPQHTTKIYFYITKKLLPSIEEQDEKTYLWRNRHHASRQHKTQGRWRAFPSSALPALQWYCAPKQSVQKTQTRTKSPHMSSKTRKQRRKKKHGIQNSFKTSQQRILFLLPLPLLLPLLLQYCVSVFLTLDISATSMRALPPSAVTGVPHSLEAQVDSPMATWCSFMMP
jgi:hypothetical protein